MTEPLEDLKEAKRRLAEATAVYNRHRYKCDTEYRERVRSYMRGRYKRKTKDCDKCGHRYERDKAGCPKCVVVSE